MRQVCLCFIAVLLCCLSWFTAAAQLTGVKTIPGNYASIALAVADVNANGIGAGGVIFNISAGYTETISTTIALTATGTAANPITFRRAPGSIGANPLITAYTGGVGTPSTSKQDGLWRLEGSDYITIDGIDLRDNPLNTANPATMEYGYALYKASTSDGCQYVTIQNCTITLNTINNYTGKTPMVDGSVGIIVMNAKASAAVTTLTPTATGTNSFNRFYANTIKSCNSGIAIVGYAAPAPYTLADHSNDVGGSSIGQGNTIINFGGAAGATKMAIGIRATAQYSLNIANNNINNNDGTNADHIVQVRGIYVITAPTASAVIKNNTISLKCAGTTQIPTGIENTAGSTPTGIPPSGNIIEISNNTISGSTFPTATSGKFYGIYNNATPTTLIMRGNTIANNTLNATGKGSFMGIYNIGAATSIDITGNEVSNNSMSAAGAGTVYLIYNRGVGSDVSMDSNTMLGNTAGGALLGTFAALYNSAAVQNLSISHNTVAGAVSSATNGIYYPLINSGAVVNTINLDSNKIGTVSSGAITFSDINTKSQYFLYNSAAGANCALSMSGNDISGINYQAGTSATLSLIYNKAIPLYQDINNNTFTNLNLNTTGKVTLILSSVPIPAGGYQNVNNNSIAGTFTKAAGSTLTVFLNGATCANGSIVNHNNNNFSNITISGATSIVGWSCKDAGSSTRTVSNNVFSNWTCGTGTVTVMSLGINGTDNAVFGNTISNITASATVTAISSAIGNDNIYGNTINNITVDTNKVIYGIVISTAGVRRVHGNKIYNLVGTAAGSIVYGIMVSGTTSGPIETNIYNNIIGSLYAPFANPSSNNNAVIGIYLPVSRANSTINVSYNTVYLDSTSNGTNFSSACLYHSSSSTATTATLNLRNNILVNIATPKGAGYVTAYRRSATNLSNYGSVSNNNLLYAGTPSPRNVLFYDGSYSDQLLTTFKTHMTGRDAQSVTEDITGALLSITGSSVNYLHINATVPSQAESGGINISGYTGDFDGNVRQGNTGYAGTGTAPDIGADEYNGITALPLSGSYTVGVGGDFTSLTNPGGLFATINNIGLIGDVDAYIISDITETGTFALNQWAEQGVGNYVLTIQPNAATMRVVSGDVAGPLIKLNGADRVVFDGSYSGANNYLTFSNTNTLGTIGTAFDFSNGATNNQITNCNLEAYANATNGVVLFNSSTVVEGNSNNQINSCNINGTIGGNTSNVCVYSAGTAGKENINNTISNNNIYNYKARGLDIPASGTSAWTISGNSFYNGAIANSTINSATASLHGIRIRGGAGYAILNNFIGGSGSNCGGAKSTYTSNGNMGYTAIMLATSSGSPISNIKGNTIANIGVSDLPNTSGSTIFIGIQTTGSGINVGGSAAGEGNRIGANNTNGSITISTATVDTTYTTKTYGILYGSTGGQIIANKIGSIDISNTGTAPAATNFTGIYVNTAIAPGVINNNVIGSAGAGAATNSISILGTSTAVNTTITGISLSASVQNVVQLNANSIRNLSHLSTANTTGGIIGIASAAVAPAAITISNDSFKNNYIAQFTSGVFCGYRNTGEASSLDITGNVFSGNGTSSGTGAPAAIVNSGAVTGAININNNLIGNSGAPAFTFDAANSGATTFINNTGGTSAATLSISNNNIQGVVYPVASTGANIYIANTAAALSQTMNGNTFTNLNVNTSGNVTFIANNVSLTAGGTKDISNNSISGTFTKAAGGMVDLYNTNATSASGTTINNTNNNFSNISISGATTMLGWGNNDNGATAKTIANNTFTNWSCGDAAVTALSVTNGTVSGNTISNITSAAGNITGISTSDGTGDIYLNNINTLSASGAGSAVVSGISLSGGAAKNVFKNKIYGLESNHAAGTVNGVLISGSSIVSANIYNNIIGDLRTPIAYNADAIRGISVAATSANATFNVYYNTVYITGTSSSSLFGTSGIYHAANATATTCVLNLRNNSITNTATPKGAGISAAIRRSSTLLGNYAATSNNNLLYGGTPSATSLIYYDGTHSDQLIGDFASRVAPAESASVSEDLTTKFSSITSSSSVFLHMDASIPSLIESGGANISGYTDDFDGQVRAGNPGYSGTGYAPDIGADEVFGVEVIPPDIVYTPLTNVTTTANRNITGIAITDGSGVNITAGTKPRIYYKRLVDANTYVDNTSATSGWKYTEATNSATPFSFTIDYSKLYGGASVTAGVIQYFIVAQDLATIANVGINSGTFNTPPVSVALTAAAFPLTGSINSYNIPFSGSYNIGNGQVYTTLTDTNGLFMAINTVGLMGHTTFNITSDITETGTNALNAWTEYLGSNYRLLIQPDATTMRTISGDAINGLIRFNGAGRIKVDGSGGTSAGIYLSFSNGNTTGTTGTALTFANGCNSDTIKYCLLEAYANAANGVILFGVSPSVTSGNSNIRVENCDINGTVAGNSSAVGICSNGTPAKENKSNIISNNNIFGFVEKGIEILSTGSSQWTITGNSIYNGGVSTLLDYPASSFIYGIRVLGGSGYTITNNYVGGTAAQAGGSNAIYSSSSGDISYQGIALTTSSASPASSIKGNIITKITVKPTTASVGLLCFAGIKTSGSGITVGGNTAGDGNTIGSNTVNGIITITTTTSAATNTTFISGIESNSAGGTVNGNLIGGVDIANLGVNPAPSIFRGVNITNASAPTQVNSNIIGSNGTGALSNSIRVRNTSLSVAPAIYGIVLNNTVASNVAVNNNIIQNINNNSPVSSGSFIGLYNNAPSPTITISGNNIKNITTTANSSAYSGAYIGIYTASAGSVSGNTVDNISYLASGTAAQLMGIYANSAAANTISNNTISNLITTSTMAADVETGSATGFTAVGILNNSSGVQTITGNIVTAIKATSTAAVNTVSAGIAVTASGASGSMNNNKISVINNTATSSALLPGICGIFAGNGTVNAYNNVVWLVNGTNTNGVKMYGINHASATNWNYFYNTVLIDGNATGTATRTAAFFRPAAGVLSLRNNNLVNTRTGNGVHYAISNIAATPAANWVSATSNYNNFYSANASQTGEWGSGASQTFAQWKSASAGEANSINRLVNFLPSAYDLEPYNIANCNLDNAAMPITTPVNITKDISNNNRNATTPDIGAYEFSYVPFVVTASNNGPACNGGTIDLAADQGNAINPVFVWRNPLMANVATIQNPTVPALAGMYKVTVTDETGCSAADSTLVALYARPTATLSGTATICENASANIIINVTGSGPISGTFTTGDEFSGNAPTITYNVSPDATTTYTISDMSDANCSSFVPVDVPDTVTISVLQGGLWTGLTSINWTQAGNWLCNIIPDTTTDVIIPSSAPYFPTISSGVVAINNLMLQNGGTLTINNATLQIGGDITTTGGAINAANGVIEMKGTSTQIIPENTFTANTLKSLTVNNLNDVGLAGTLNLTDVLKITSGDFYTGGFLKLISSATKTAVIDGTNTGEVYDSVTMERYLPSGFGYHYISSPFVAAKVSHLASSVDLNASFPQLYLYDEDKPLSGFVAYTTLANRLYPLVGYAANFGTSIASAKISLRGIVNNGAISSSTLYNHNHTYTKGFNLVGNPYPSPIDWNAASGWAKTNIDNAVYYFNNGTTDQYTGTYSSYINGVSSDGVANNIIPSMQGFFIHVSDGAYPVSGSLGVTNLARVNNLNPSYHKVTQTLYPLVRLALKADEDTVADYAVIYMDDDATDNYDPAKDALKLINTDTDIPNIYAVSNDGQRLSISAVLAGSDTDRIVSLGIQSYKGGLVKMDAMLVENLPLGVHAYLLDANNNTAQDLQQNDSYTATIGEGNTEDRFFIVFSKKLVTEVADNTGLNVFSSGSIVSVMLDAYTGQGGDLIIRNMQGQVVYNTKMSGYGRHDISLPVASGIYIVSYGGNKKVITRKVVIGK